MMMKMLQRFGKGREQPVADEDDPKKTAKSMVGKSTRRVLHTCCGHADRVDLRPTDDTDPLIPRAGTPHESPDTWAPSPSCPVISSGGAPSEVPNGGVGTLPADIDRGSPAGSPADGAVPGYPRALMASMSLGMTLVTSPTTPRSAMEKIGASGSLLTATMFFAPFIPTMCWVAPEIPKAM